VIASNPNDATTTLDDPDYRLVKALQTAQQNFVISVRTHERERERERDTIAYAVGVCSWLCSLKLSSSHPAISLTSISLLLSMQDPSLPDNPIVYASSGFLRLRYALSAFTEPPI